MTEADEYGPGGKFESGPDAEPPRQDIAEMLDRIASPLWEDCATIFTWSYAAAMNFRVMATGGFITFHFYKQQDIEAVIKGCEGIEIERVGLLALRVKR